MTDEKLTFVEDIKEKRSTANGIHYRKGTGGLSKVTLSQDGMSKKEIESKHGPVQGWNLRRPMLWSAFKNMSADLQREYFSNMYSFGGTDQKIAVMFNVSMQTITVAKSQIGISYSGNGKEIAGKWTDFIKGLNDITAQECEVKAYTTGDILEAVDYSVFKTWSAEHQKNYLLAIIERFHLPHQAMAELFNITPSMVHLLYKKHGIEFRYKAYSEWAVDEWQKFIQPVVQNRKQEEKLANRSEPVIFETPKEDHCRPMKWSEIKCLTDSDKKTYFEFLIKGHHASYHDIGRMAGVDSSRIRTVCKSLGVDCLDTLRGCRRNKEDNRIWAEWLNNFEKEGEEMDTNRSEPVIFDASMLKNEPNVFGKAMKELETVQKELNDKLLTDGFVGADAFIAKARPDAIPEDIRKETLNPAKLISFNMTLQVHSWDELHEVLKNLPFPEGKSIHMNTSPIGGYLENK